MRRARRGSAVRVPILGMVLVSLLALGRCAPAYDIDTLLDGLESRDFEARQEAGETIQKILRTGDFQVFLRGLRSPDMGHRAQSIVFLSQMDKPEARKALRDLLRLDRRMMLPFNPIRLKPASEPSDSRVLVAHLIATAGGDPEAIGTLLEGVDRDQPTEVLTATCFAIGALGDPKGIPFLAGATRSAEVEVVRAAAQALERFKEPEALQALKGIASHPLLEVRSDVLTSIEEREDPAAIEILETMGTSDASPDLREAAIRALMLRSRSESFVPYFIERLADGNPGVRAAAREALAKVAGRDLGAGAARWTQWWKENRARLLATVR